MIRHCQKSFSFAWIGLLFASILAFAKDKPLAKIAPAAESDFGPAAARETAKHLTIADGLEATLFASEPQLCNPTDMDVDERGRVWVTESVNYGAKTKNVPVRDPAGDRVIILEDTNHDGIADTRKVFYQNPDINSPYGIGVFGNRVIVCASPNVFSLTDTNGDGKADKKETIFVDVGGHDRDHSIHAFVFGPEGKLYFNFGNRGDQLKRAGGELVRDIDGNEIIVQGKQNERPKSPQWRQGVVFRCNFDMSGIEVLAHNFRNPYETALDSFGTMWQSDNDDDGHKGTRLNYVMEYGNFGYTDEMTGAGWREPHSNLEEEIPRRHWHQNDPGVVPNLLNTGAGAPAGMCVYEGDLMPQLRGQILYCETVSREARAVRVEPDGAGYRASSSVVLTTTNLWFRPSDVCVGPDGAIYVSDWHDTVVGGHNMVEQDMARMAGRIYRIAPKGSKPRVPKVDFTSAAGCAEALKSPNLATRYLAWTKLHAMQSKAEKELFRLWSGKDDRTRARALQLLGRIEGNKSRYLEQALKDSNPDIRMAALRTARGLKLNVISFVAQLVSDSSPQVRRECAIALHHNSSPEAPKLWAQLAQQHDGKDRWYLEALGIGADAQWDKYFEAWLAVVGYNWDTPSGRDIVWRSRSSKTPALLVKLIADKSTSERERARYFRALDFVPAGPEKEQALLQLLTSAR